jgi:hypothetical protein
MTGKTVQKVILVAKPEISALESFTVSPAVKRSSAIQSMIKMVMLMVPKMDNHV